MVRLTRFMTEAVEGLTAEEQYALNAFLSNPQINSPAVEAGKGVYMILQRLENAFPKKGEVVFGQVRHTGAYNDAALVGRRVKGKSYTTLVTVGHNAGTLLRKYREYSQQYPNLHIARTTLGYALMIPV